MITKKHYKAIAEIINSEYRRYDNTSEDDTEAKLAIKYIVINLTTYFALDNPLFNHQKFTDACGLN